MDNYKSLLFNYQNTKSKILQVISQFEIISDNYMDMVKKVDNNYYIDNIDNIDNLLSKKIMDANTNICHEINYLKNVVLPSVDFQISTLKRKINDMVTLEGK